MANNILIIDNGSQYIDDLAKIFPFANIQVLEPPKIRLTEAEKKDMVLLSGGYTHPLDNSDGFYTNEIELVNRTKVPTAGICLGFQLIAQTYGSPINKMSFKRYGLFDIYATDIGKELIGKASLRVFENHQYMVLDAPSDFEVLAKSEDGIEGMQHTSLPLIGFQFHPEVTDNNDGINFLEAALARIKKRSNNNRQFKTQP